MYAKIQVRIDTEIANGLIISEASNITCHITSFPHYLNLMDLLKYVKLIKSLLARDS